MNALENVTHAVDALGEALPDLLGQCTDPQAADMAELLLVIQQARVALQAIERDTEVACARALSEPLTEAPGLRIERYRSADRKAWQHDRWQDDVRAKALRTTGLLKAQAIITADGEELDPGVLHDLLRAVQGVHGAAAPKTTSLKQLGLDPDDYCERSPGAWHVKVQRVVDETETTEGESDAA
jgi:hypothetical protein